MEPIVHQKQQEASPGDDNFYASGVSELVPYMEVLEIKTTKEDFPLIADQDRVGEVVTMLQEVHGKDKDKIITELLKLKSKLGTPRTTYLNHIYTYLKLNRQANTLKDVAKSYLK